ncbi:hypothetical protein [Rhodoferax saidenbachensis]|uniref:Uncharacterized protein n=1 Tax=Rhodoferax saidenbachensis TaxID=1484693 RepID=A0ABU1ZLB5_9BURK|nr:hypothetical protein [Rhodoferax saidenbachensis]
MLDLNDKTILVSLRKIDNEGEETFDTFFGTVVSFNENTVRVLRPSGDEMSLPYDEEVFELAETGFYELKDGSTFENPSFTARWTVFASKEASINFRKKNEAAVGQG